MKISLGEGRNLSIDKTGAIYQTNRPGGRNLYFTKSSGFKRVTKGGRNPKDKALDSLKGKQRNFTK